MKDNTRNLNKLQSNSIVQSGSCAIVSRAAGRQLPPTAHCTGLWLPRAGPDPQIREIRELAAGRSGSTLAGHLDQKAPKNKNDSNVDLGN